MTRTYGNKDFVGLRDTPQGFAGPVNDFTKIEFAELGVEVNGSSSTLEFHPLPQDDPLQRQPDIMLAKQHLGWGPTVQLRKGLGRTIDCFRQLATNERSGPATNAPSLRAIS